MTHLILPDSPSSVLQLLNADKKALDQFANTIINDVQEGRENPLEIALLVKKYEYVLKTITEAIKPNVNTEVAKYGDKEFEYGSAKMHYTPTSTSYDYNLCNDPVLNDLLEKQTNINELVKSRQERLKAQKETETVISLDGEIHTINPPNKKQMYGLKITLK
jgi:hypothetical protein